MMTIDLPRLARDNDAALQEWRVFILSLKPKDRENPGLSFRHRDLIYGIENAVSAFYCSASDFYQDRDLLPLAETGARILLQSLNADGTCNSINLASPPDTAFITERAGAVLMLLKNRGEGRENPLYRLLEEYLEKTCHALVSGGIHTPNHRWVVSSALSYGFALLGRPEYKARAEAWLAEGVDGDEDGQFSERSVSIYSPVTVLCLLNLVDYLGREDLLPVVRKNLDTTLLYFKPDGRLVTVASRRQDVFSEGLAIRYFLPYLIMAGRDQRREYAEAAQLIQETGEHFDGLTEILSGRVEEPLPAPSRSLPVEGSRFLPGSGLFRSWEKGRFYTVFGGCDNYGIQASGLSSSPDVFSFQKGACRLESLRIAPQFFSTGYFRADSMEYKEGRCLLKQKRQVPYFNRLGREFLQAEGNYPLTFSGRYWSKMDFPRRDHVNTQELEIQVLVAGGEEGVRLEISSEGSSPVPIALEFCFPGEGDLKGQWLDPSDGPRLFGRHDGPQADNVKVLKEGYASYSCKGETLRIGPGHCEHDWLPYQQIKDFFPLEEDLLKKQIMYLTLYAPFRIAVEVLSNP